MSADVRFIADLHIGHKNIAISRGFSSVEEHDKLIIDNWNRVVRKRDVTYIVGDLNMEKKNYEFLDQLNGVKKVILGNHDQGKYVPHLLEKVNYVCGAKNYKDGIFITHVPIAERELQFKRSSINIHGHIHEQFVERSFLGIKFRDNRYWNVSCEAIGYTPRTIEELKIIYKPNMLGI